MINPGQLRESAAELSRVALSSNSRKLLNAMFSVLPARRYLLAAALALLVLAALFARSMSRFFDLDEHQFTAPGVLLQDGLLPYADYPYFHMPNLIYIYGGLMSVTSYKLFAARLVSVFCGWVTIILLFRVGWKLFADQRISTRWWIAGGLSVIFLCCRLFTYTNGWAWNHDSAVVCALGAFMLHIRGLKQAKIWPFACAGLLVGLAIGIRLSFGLIGVPFALSLLCGRSSLSSRRRCLGLGVAVLAACISLVPVLIPMWINQEAFFFGNLGYARLNTIFYSHIESPAMNTVAKLLHGLQVAFSDPGNAVLVLLATYTLGYRMWRLRAWTGAYGNELLLILGLLPALLVGCWGPTPTQYQYYYMLLPFMVLGIFYTLASEAPACLEGKTFRDVLSGAVLLVGLSGIPRWYWTIIYLPTPQRWVPIQVHQVGEWVRANTPKGARVLTIDPLVPCEGGRQVYPEYAIGRFMMHVGPYMTSEERHRHRIAWGEELERLLVEQPPEAILIDGRVLFMVPEFVRYTQSNGFRLLESPDKSFQLWVRTSARY